MRRRTDVLDDASLKGLERIERLIWDRSREAVENGVKAFVYFSAYNGHMSDQRGTHRSRCSIHTTVLDFSDVLIDLILRNLVVEDNDVAYPRPRSVK